MTDPAPADPVADHPVEERLTRAGVAKRLRITIWKVRQLEGKRLHPTIGDDGVRLFDPGEVAIAAHSLKPRRLTGPGAVAAVVFRRLGEGATLRQLVIELEQPPELLRKLYDEWRTDFDEGRRMQQRRDREARDREEARAIDRMNRTYDRDARRDEKSLGRIVHVEPPSRGGS